MEANASQVLDAFRRNSNNANITQLYIERNISDMSDDVVDGILDVIVSSAAGSLNLLSLAHSNLTRVPEAVRNFSQLTSFDMNLSSIEVLTAATFTFSVDAFSVSFFSTQLKIIQPGAIQGNEMK